MNTEAIEIWLTTSVLGIIVLGASGSIVAILAWKFIIYLIANVIPAPYLAHQTRSLQRAFTLGYAASTFSRDKKGHTSTIFFAYRLSRLIIALFMFLCLLIIFSLVLALSSEVVVTFGTFLVITLSFISLYWAYSEYEFIRLTYKSFWMSAEEAARERKYGRKDEEVD